MGFLQVKGTDIYDVSTNKKFLTRGINFQNRSLDANETDVATDYVGFGEDSYDDVANMGFNAVRLLMAENWKNHSNVWEFLDEQVENCRRNNLRLMLNIHYPLGGRQILNSTTKANAVEFWSNTTIQDAFIDFWVQIATRYANEPVIYGYDLINEPYVTNGSNYYSCINRCISRIRQVDTNHMIILNDNGGIDLYTNGVRNITDNNIIWDMHNYTKAGYTHQGVSDANVYNITTYNVGTNNYSDDQNISLVDYLEAKANSWDVKDKASYKVPLMSGEIGTNYYTCFADGRTKSNGYTNNQTYLGGWEYIKSVIDAYTKHNLHFFAFSYAGDEWGLFYSSTSGYGTNSNKLRQASWDKLWNIMNNTHYDHIFKTTALMQAYSGVIATQGTVSIDEPYKIGDFVLNFETNKSYIVTNAPTELALTNGLYAEEIEADDTDDKTAFITDINLKNILVGVLSQIGKG